MLSVPFIALFLLCLAVSFLLSGMEAGLLALSPFRIRHWMRTGNPRAATLHQFLQNPETFLWTVLVGNTVANILAVSLGVLALYSWLVRWPLLLLPAFLIATLLFYVFFELLPKTLFRLYPNRLCLLLATPFRAVHFAFKPLVSLMALISRWLGAKRFTSQLFGNRHELRLLLQESNPTLTQEERLMISRVLDLHGRLVGDIATPIQQAVGVNTEASLGHVLNLGRQHGFSRFPVWHAPSTTPSLAGIVHLKELLLLPSLDPAEPVSRHLKPALTLSSQSRLDEALLKMQQHRQRLAIVTGPDQRPSGLISLQDILKAIFGEINL